MGLCCGVLCGGGLCCVVLCWVCCAVLCCGLCVCVECLFVRVFCLFVVWLCRVVCVCVHVCRLSAAALVIAGNFRSAVDVAFSSSCLSFSCPPSLPSCPASSLLPFRRLCCRRVLSPSFLLAVVVVLASLTLAALICCHCITLLV